jgi:hypothetical protein
VIFDKLNGLLNEDKISMAKLYPSVESLIKKFGFNLDIDIIGNTITINVPAGFITLGEDQLGNMEFIFSCDDFKKSLIKLLGDNFKYDISNNLNIITITQA